MRKRCVTGTLCGIGGSIVIAANGCASRDKACRNLVTTVGILMLTSRTDRQLRLRSSPGVLGTGGERQCRWRETRRSRR
jgi:hypothetical protein